MGWFQFCFQTLPCRERAVLYCIIGEYSDSLLSYLLAQTLLSKTETCWITLWGDYQG